MDAKGKLQSGPPNAMYAKESAAAPILPARLDWPSAIGLFIINLGVLDYETLDFLKQNLAPTEFIRLREKHFKDRITRIAKLLAEKRYSAAERKAFSHFSHCVEKPRELRNHIAHGFILFRIGDDMKPSVTLCKTRDIEAEHLPDSMRLEFEELACANSALSELIEEFVRLKRDDGAF